ncbi:MAG: hypothetical protein J0H29_18980 [Sphingobacteriales bacterium]|nr:hypothetical protein [Sphingobacteriales bacterium]OJY85803.1 MAG: hypothetical protein BGP14_17870 [Sphingobacteriales bacterium 44-15]
MQTIMYANKFIDNEIVSKNGIKLRTFRLAEVHIRLKKGENIFCIDSDRMVTAIARDQGVIRGQWGQWEGNRYLTKVTIVEYDKPKIHESAIVCLLDILSNLFFYRFESVNKEFKYIKRERAKIKEKISHEAYPDDYVSMISQLILQGFELMENERFVLSLLRFSKAYLRTDFRDVVLDCSSSIEALFNFSKELKLRYTLAAYHIDIVEPSYTSMIVKKLYDVRSKIIHGRTVEEINDNQFIGDILTANQSLLISIMLRNHMFTDDELTEEILNHYKGLDQQ